MYGGAPGDLVIAGLLWEMDGAKVLDPFSGLRATTSIRRDRFLNLPAVSVLEHGRYWSSSRPTRDQRLTFRSHAVLLSEG